MLKMPQISLSLVAFATFLYFYLGNAPLLLIFQQDLNQTDYWRLFTAQWVHHSFPHFFWNSAALFIIALIFESFFKKEILSMLFCGFCGVAVYLALVTDFKFYCGLSGALMGLLTAGLLKLMCLPQWRLPAFLTFVGLLIKITIESQGNTLFVQSQDWSVVPWAHVFGAAGGVCYFVFNFFFYHFN